MLIEIPDGRSHEWDFRPARLRAVPRAQQAATSDIAVPLELAVPLLAVYAGDRRRSWAERSVASPLPTGRVGIQGVAAPPLEAAAGSGGARGRWAFPWAPRVVE